MEYLSWIEARPDAVAHGLASSDLRPATHAHGPIPRRLRDRPDPPGEPALDALDVLVADQYGVTPAEVLVTAGATNANALAFAVAAGGSHCGSDVTLDGEGPARPGGPVVDGDAAPPSPLEEPGDEPMTGTSRGFGARTDRHTGWRATRDALGTVLDDVDRRRWPHPHSPRSCRPAPRPRRSTGRPYRRPRRSVHASTTNI